MTVSARTITKSWTLQPRGASGVVDSAADGSIALRLFVEVHHDPARPERALLCDPHNMQVPMEVFETASLPTVGDLAE